MKDNIISNIILGTGNYDSIKSGNTVSITGDGGNAWNYFGNAYKKLAPRLVTYKQYAKHLEELNNLKNDATKVKEYLNFRTSLEDNYIKSYYETRLRGLNIYDLIEILESMYGDNIILLCHEPVDEFCHRRLVADYIELKTGVYIPEISIDQEGNLKKIKPIRYKKRLERVMSE